MDRILGVQPTRATRAICLTFALVLALPLLLPQAGAVPVAHADEVADEDFAIGFGSARGTGVRVGPSRSGFAFTTDFAISLADFQNTVARGDSRGVSLGTILETVAESFDEDGEYLPQNLRTDSRDEDAADGVSRTEFGLPEESPFAGALGSQYVRATDDPFAEVETLMGVLGIDGVLELEGGTSRATAGIVEAGQREARGEATFERINIGDTILLEGLQWTATHRSGAEDASTATFALGDFIVAGESVLPEDAGEQGAEGMAEAFDAANEVLAETGLSLVAPEEVVNEDTGQVSMTPLKIALGSTDTSRSIAGPLNENLQPLREPLADALIGAYDSFGAIFLLFDVGMGAFAGGGELLLEIGGARAVTGSQDFDNPFGDFGGGFGEGFGEVPEDATPQTEDSFDMPSEGPPTDLEEPSGPDRGGPTEAPAPQASQEADEAVDEPVTSEPPEQAGGQQEELATPAGIPGERGGQALIAALIALLVAAGLGGADFLRLRQSQRTIPGAG